MIFINLPAPPPIAKIIILEVFE